MTAMGCDHSYDDFYIMDTPEDVRKLKSGSVSLVQLKASAPVAAGRLYIAMDLEDVWLFLYLCTLSVFCDPSRASGLSIFVSAFTVFFLSFDFICSAKEGTPLLFLGR